MNSAITPRGGGSGPARPASSQNRTSCASTEAGVAPRALRFSAKLALQRAFVAAPTD
jgi:hypothetical protein